MTMTCWPSATSFRKSGISKVLARASPYWGSSSCSECGVTVRTHKAVGPSELEDAFLEQRRPLDAAEQVRLEPAVQAAEITQNGRQRTELRFDTDVLAALDERQE